MPPPDNNLNHIAAQRRMTCVRRRDGRPAGPGTPIKPLGGAVIARLTVTQS